MRRNYIALILPCFVLGAHASFAAPPSISKLSLHGMQIGGKTTIVVEGKDLLPDPVLVATFPIASQTVKPDGKANRVEIEVELTRDTLPGIGNIRVANAKGISAAMTVGLDPLPQQAFVEKVDALPVALHGRVSGTQVLATRFQATQGQRIVADVEAQRLGAKFKPVLRVKDAQGGQLAWDSNRHALGGDARVSFEVPADGEYTVELHDVLFRAGAPGFFRLKLGPIHYADLVFPSGAQTGKTAQLQFAGTNLPSDASASLDAASLAPATIPAPVQDLANFSGIPPRLAITTHPEHVENLQGTDRQELSPAPCAISGRLVQPNEEDQFAIPVTPGSRLRFEVFAQRLGSPVDAVLSIRNEKGEQVAMNDDRPGMADSAVEYKVPNELHKLIVAVKDLIGRGGSDFVYRVEISDLAEPDFNLVAEDDDLNVPAGGNQILQFQVTRRGYNGPITLSVDGLPANMQIQGERIPAGADIGLLCLQAAEGSSSPALARIVARSADNKTSLERFMSAPASEVNQLAPWLRNHVALAVGEPAPVRIAWSSPNDSPLPLGSKLPLSVDVQRTEGAKGSVRLRLISTFETPTTKEKQGRQQKEVDDTERSLRLEDDKPIPADAKQATVNLLVPADLPNRSWGFALAADLLGADNKTVVSTTTTTVLYKKPEAPFTLELVSAEKIEAKAGMGETGKLSGKIRRREGFTEAVTVSLQGLPKDYSLSALTVPGDRTEFEWPIRFPYGAKATELKGVKAVAEFVPNSKRPELLVKSDAIDLAPIHVVAGEPPPAAENLVIFEDDDKFLGMLSKGGGTITLETQEKHSGNAAIKVTPDQRYHESLPTLNVKIRETPGAGEYRYLRFAWKKKGGSSICFQINHDGNWGPGQGGKEGAKFRYHAGPGGECYGASVVVDEKLPSEFVVVTRDLFADFGEFTFTGLALSPVDGEYALFDHLYLGRSAADLDQIKVSK